MSGMSKGGLFLLPPELLSGTWRSTCIVIVVVSRLGTRRRVYIPCSPWSHRNDCCHWVKRLFKTRCLTRPDLSNWVTPRKWSDIHALFMMEKKNNEKKHTTTDEKTYVFSNTTILFFFCSYLFLPFEQKTLMQRWWITRCEETKIYSDFRRSGYL